MLNTGVSTNTFDVANRLTQSQRATTTLQVAYNGLNDRVSQTIGATTTNFALDVAGGLPEVIATSGGTTYLHLPGVIVAQNSAGQKVYLLSDGLGSIRQVISGTTIVSQRDFDAYGNPITTTAFSDPYGYTGEWWEKDVKLLHLRARWLEPSSGIFLSKDPWPGSELKPQSKNGWNYVEGNPINRVDPTGQSWWSPTRFEGTLIHKMIQADYIAKAGAEGRVARAEVPVEFASKTNTTVVWGVQLPERVPLPDFTGDELEPGRADIVDFSFSSVYEIKYVSSRWTGFADAVWYRDHLDEDPTYQGWAPWRLGGPEGYLNGLVADWPGDPDAWVTAYYEMPGVIVYVGVPKPKRILEWCFWGVLIYMGGKAVLSQPGGYQQLSPKLVR